MTRGTRGSRVPPASVRRALDVTGPALGVTPEFKAGAVKLAQEGKSIPQVAEDLDLTESALRL